MKQPYPSTYAAKSLEMIARCAVLLERGATGREIYEHMGCSHNVAWLLLTYCIEKRGITRHGVGRGVRYFMDAAVGKAWDDERARLVAERAKERERNRSRIARPNPKPRPLNLALQRFKDAEASNPNGVQKQVCPCGQDNRYRVTEPIRDGVRDMGIGRYLEASHG